MTPKIPGGGVSLDALAAAGYFNECTASHRAAAHLYFEKIEAAKRARLAARRVYVIDRRWARLKQAS